MAFGVCRPCALWTCAALSSVSQSDVIWRAAFRYGCLRWTVCSCVCACVNVCGLSLCNIIYCYCKVNQITVLLVNARYSYAVSAARSSRRGAKNCVCNAMQIVVSCCCCCCCCSATVLWQHCTVWLRSYSCGGFVVVMYFGKLILMLCLFSCRPRRATRLKRLTDGGLKFHYLHKEILPQWRLWHDGGGGSAPMDFSLSFSALSEFRDSQWLSLGVSCYFCIWLLLLLGDHVANAITKFALPHLTHKLRQREAKSEMRNWELNFNWKLGQVAEVDNLLP